MVGFTDSVDDWMQTFDVLLQTSVVEGLPNTLIEAQYCGVPVVTTDSGGSKETIVDGVTGFCSSGFEVKELGDLVLTALLMKIGQKMRKKNQRFGLERISVWIKCTTCFFLCMGWKNETCTTYCRQSWLGI